ncbi:MAG: type II toxin-antitoxin system RelE/ParE family toxin [Defluviitaleaceae bacterium]|nr:type II toxin-antitoxin system RelE/ParE family toxin [Defluviitaleaceae bacterium]MCL2274241.1 type II toxin-antitoxin system RelE/ParE family toxin [Defluviitaleaceae bacterium]
MKFNINYLPSFARDLHKIAKALEPYPNKAARLLKEMDEKLLLLEDTPMMCPIFYDRPKYRKMILEDHVLFYTVDEGAYAVRVHHILYARSNISDYIKG